MGILEFSKFLKKSYKAMKLFTRKSMYIYSVSNLDKTPFEVRTGEKHNVSNLRDG